MTSVGLDVSARRINLSQLADEMTTAGVDVPMGLTVAGPAMPPPLTLIQTDAYPPYPDRSRLFTYDDQQSPQPIDLPAGAQAVVDAHVPT
jgi:hypothetical protein